MKIRKPYVAGSFYPRSVPELKDRITASFTHPFGPGALPSVSKPGARRIIGMVAPHAGYVYSGPVAANGYYSVAADGVPETFIILGPNHTGYGSGVSTFTDGGWETPLGVTHVDGELSARIQKRSGVIDVDDAAHAYEHSIEVQLPFIQFLFGEVPTFVPICMMMQDLETSREIAQSIAHEAMGRDMVMVASSDFTHYEPHDQAKMKDERAINAITELDDASLNELGESGKVTMCGYGPITTLIATLKMLGQPRAKLLSYKTSGDITGDKDSVVGYSSIIFTRDR